MKHAQISSSWSSPKGSGGKCDTALHDGADYALNTRRIRGAAKNIEIPGGVTVEGVELSKPTELLGAKAVSQSGGLRYGFLSAFENESSLIGRVGGTGEEVSVISDGRDFGVARLLYESSADRGEDQLATSAR